MKVYSIHSALLNGDVHFSDEVERVKYVSAIGLKTEEYELSERMALNVKTAKEWTKDSSNAIRKLLMTELRVAMAEGNDQAMNEAMTKLEKLG